jgi:hypothetical protein
MPLSVSAGRQRIDLDSSALSRQDQVFRAAQSGADYDVGYEAQFR